MVQYLTGNLCYTEDWHITRVATSRRDASDRCTLASVDTARCDLCILGVKRCKNLS